MITLCLQEFEEKVLQEWDKQSTGTPSIPQRKFGLSHISHMLLTMHAAKRSVYTYLPDLTATATADGIMVWLLQFSSPALLYSR